MHKSFLTFVISAVMLSMADAEEPDEQPLPLSPFDGIIFERILNEGTLEPLFIDIDSGRFFTPPLDVVSDKQRRNPLKQWTPTNPLLQWVQDHGADLVAQTDGKEITLVGVDLRIGEPIPGTVSLSKIPRSRIAQKANAVQSNIGQWFLMPTMSADKQFPFLTREGGLGIFSIHLMEFDFRGAHSMRFRYQLTRDPDIVELTNVPITVIPEPPLLGQFDGLLIADRNRDVLRLRVPPSQHVMEIDRSQVVLRDGSNHKLRFARLCTGVLDVRAKDLLVKIYGRGKEGTIQLDGQRVRMELDKQFTEAEHITFQMPELKVYSSTLKWSAVTGGSSE